MGGLGEPGMGHEHLGLGVLHDVGDLRADQVVVDRDQVPPRLQAREVQLDELASVGQHGRDHVTDLEPEGAQAVHELVGGRQQIAGAQ